MGVAGGPQPAIVPSRVAKMNTAGLPAAKAKSALPLNIIPVGWDGPATPCALGMVTISGTAPPAPLYRVDVPVPALFTHHGDEAPRDRPQAFCKLASMLTAEPSALAGWAMSDTRLVCT